MISNKFSKKHRRFFEIAKQISKMSNFPKVKIGCILVLNKKHIIATGCNKTKTHPHQYKLNKQYKSNTYKSNNSFIHAEIDAIKSLSESFMFKHNQNLSDVEIYLYREDMTGNMAQCRPCPSCLSNLIQLGIKKIHYTSSAGFHTETIHIS